MELRFAGGGHVSIPKKLGKWFPSFRVFGLSLCSVWRLPFATVCNMSRSIRIEGFCVREFRGSCEEVLDDAVFSQGFWEELHFFCKIDAAVPSAQFMICKNSPSRVFQNPLSVECTSISNPQTQRYPTLRVSCQNSVAPPVSFKSRISVQWSA